MKKDLNPQMKWRVESRSMSDGSLVIKNVDHDEICCIREKADRVRGYQDNLDIERGKIICHAVNSHEKLVEALKRIADRVKYHAGGEAPFSLEAIGNEARAAIAAAQGESAVESCERRFNAQNK